MKVNKRRDVIEEEKGSEKGEYRELVRGVFFVPHTENSELAKRIREKLRSFEEISVIRVKIVERIGEKIVDILHKSNPWEAVHCMRDDCVFCNSNNEKLIGKCKKRNIVYETECLICKGELRDADGVELNEREESLLGAVPSSQQGPKHGVAPQNEMKWIGEKEGWRGAVLSRQQGFNGVVPDNNEMKWNGTQKERMESHIEITKQDLRTLESNKGGEEIKKGAVLSSDLQVGVVPSNEKRKRKANEV